jgi:hypothetical protein
MMNQEEVNKAKHYIRDLVSGGLFITESKKVAKSLLIGMPDDDWVRLFTEENILMKNSPNTAIRYARTIKRRLLPLGKSYSEAIVDSSEPNYVQLLMVALMIYTPVVPDFMGNVIAETKRVYMQNLAVDAWDIFLQDRTRRLPGLLKFSESTLQKTGTNTVRALVEAGYLDNNKNRQLLPVYLLPETKIWLQKLNREDLEPILECTL